MSLPLCSTLINCYHTVNYKHCNKKKKKIRSILGSEVHVCPREWSIWVWILSYLFFYSVATNVFITSCFGSHWYWHQICAQIWLVDTIYTVMLGKQFVCGCEQERQEERKCFFYFIRLFCFCKWEWGKKETGQGERGKLENRLQLSIREVIGQRRLHYLLFRRAHSLYSREAIV